MNNELREAHKDWLFRDDWYRGENRTLYDELVSEKQKIYNMSFKKLTPGSLHFKLTDSAKECLDVSLEKATWENFQKKVSDPKH